MITTGTAWKTETKHLIYDNLDEVDTFLHKYNREGKQLRAEHYVDLDTTSAVYEHKEHHCSICLEGHFRRFNACGHILGEVCMEKLINESPMPRNHRCPECRTSIFGPPISRRNARDGSSSRKETRRRKKDATCQVMEELAGKFGELRLILDS